MEIHSGNFEECFPIVSNAIDGATFIAFDTEFTGLDDGCQITGLDTPEKRYFKLLKPAKDYLIIQFGLSIFTKVPGLNKYIAESFNFSIFPRTTKFTPNVTIKFQGPSLEFVTYQGVDMDEIIKKGIPYLSVEGERKIRERLLRKHSEETEELESEGSRSRTPLIEVPHWKKEFVERQIKKVEDAISSGTKETTLEPCDLLSKLIIFDQLNARFSNQLLLEADATRGSDSVVVKATFVEGPGHKKEVLARRHEEELKELKAVLGFARIVRLLHESNKLIIGHNMLLDVMHTISQFWGTLPHDYGSFKELVHHIFPRILDTKHMASMDPFKSMTNNRNLRELYDELKTNKKISGFVLEMREGFPDYMSQSSYHNASYDAFVTGVCFLLMKSYLCGVQKHLKIEDKLSPYENKLYLMRIVDVPYINLSGDDLPLTTREHIFHFQFFRNRSISDIKNLFAPFGDVDVRFIDDNSAFVCMLDKEKSALANRKLSSQRDSWYKLQPLAEWYSSRNEGGHQGNHGNAVTREGSIKRKLVGEGLSSFGTEIIQENFEESILSLSQAVDEATFLAVDTVSLGFDHERHGSPFDSPDGRYKELFEPVRNHLMVQFGLCAFKKVSGQNKFEVKPFNFNVYPKSSKLAPEVYFESRNSELERNASQGLSIGKIVNEGVTYLSISNERSLSEKLLARPTAGRRDRSEQNRDNHNSCPTTLVPVSKQEFVDKQIKEVEKLLTSRSTDSLTLEPCNSFTRKLLYEQLHFRFPDRLFIETTDAESTSPPLIKVTFVDGPEHRKELEMKRHDKKLEDLHRALGFTRIIKMLHESNKLIVGHKMLHRIMHLINQFWSPLPSDYKTFKALAGQVFTRVLDTKHVASSEPFKGLIKGKEPHDIRKELESLRRSANIAIEFPPEFSDHQDVRSSALEAYTAGMCYLLMKSHLGALQKNTPVDEKMGSYENKLHVSNLEEQTFANIRGSDPPMSREHTFHVQLKKNKDPIPVLNILSSTGKLKMLNETSAVVIIHNEEKLATAKKDLSSMKVKFEPLADWLSARDHQGHGKGQGTSVLRESPPNLKRKHVDDVGSIKKKIPAKRKPQQLLDSPGKNGEGVFDPSKMFHLQPKKSEGVQRPPLFEVPDDWD